MAAIYQTLNDVFADVRFNVAKDEYTLTDADLLRIANKYYLYIVRELMNIKEDLYGQISSIILQEDQSEYILPIDDTTGDPPNDKPYGGGLVSIMRVETSYDGSNWYVNRNVSTSQIPNPTTLVSNLNNIYSKTSPIYWFFDRSIFLAPVPDSSDNVGGTTPGIFIWWIQRPAEMAETSDIPNIPKDYLNILTEGIMIDVFRKFARPQDMRTSEQNFLNYIEKMKFSEANIDLNEPLYLQASKKRYT